MVGSIIGLIVYIVAMLGLLVFFALLALRFVRAHERGAAALEQIARTLDAPRRGAP